MKQTVHDLDADAEWEYTARRLKMHSPNLGNL